MSSTKLKEDLSNCLINFDRRVLISEILDDYGLSYAEVNIIVQNYLAEQEDNLKFEKRYLVHGLQEDEHKKEIFKIVKEPKLQKWLSKLKNSESSLYSVEVAGGAKSAAPVFKPMRIEECAKATSRFASKASITNGKAKCSTAPAERKHVKQENTTFKIKESPNKLEKTPKKEPLIKKSTPKKENSPPEKKANDKKAAAKKGINNFFAPSTSSKKSDDVKPTSGIVKPSTPKKMQDIFKKQSEKPECKEKHEIPAANISVQLFDEVHDEPEDESSDEEEKLEALKRDIKSSDIEMEEENNRLPANSAKRRRILDSDDEDDPPLKHEKIAVKKETKEEEAVEETYLDEEGFVITKKPKQKAATPKNKSPAAKKMPPVTIKPSPKKTKLSKLQDTKMTTNTTTKTKQARIMNFFSKK